MKHILRLSLLVVLVLSACSKNKVLQGMPVEKKMQKGESYYEKGKYNVAKEYYSSIIYDRNSVYTSKAQMKLADCYYHMNKFIDARFEYEELIRLFPDYQEISRAYYMIGLCYYEESLPAHYTQEETLNAITAFETFIEKFPYDELVKKSKDYLQKCRYRLLEKKYWNGYSYFKIYDYSAALLYFNEVLEVNLTDQIDKMSLFYSAKIYIKRENWNLAEEVYKKLKEKYPESKETYKLGKMFKL